MNIKKSFIFSFLITAALLLSACKSSDQSISVTSFEVDASTQSIAIGYLVNLKATASFSNYTSEEVSDKATYTVSDNEILTASNKSSNVFKALKIGDAVINVTYRGYEENINITVTDVELLDIKLSPTEPNVAKGNSLKINANGTYSDGVVADIAESVIWSSSDETMATLDDSGVLTAKSTGSVEITATSNGISSSPLTVQVNNAILIGLEAQDNKTKLYPKDTAQLKLSMSDGEANDTEINNTSWISSDDSVIKVNSNGLLTALSEGNATISAEYQNITKSIDLSVLPHTLKSIKITGESEIEERFDTKLTATGTSEKSTEYDITTIVSWTSSDDKIATVNDKGLVTAISKGTTTITAEESDIKKEFEVKVKPLQISSITVKDSLTIREGSPSIIEGRDSQLKAEGVATTNGMKVDITKLANWNSSNESVLTVSDTGLVTAQADGTADITVEFNGVEENISIKVIEYSWIYDMSASIYSAASSCLNNSCNTTYSIIVKNNSADKVQLTKVNVYSTDTTNLIKSFTFETDSEVNEETSVQFSLEDIKSSAPYHTITFDVKNMSSDDKKDFSITTK